MNKIVGEIKLVGITEDQISTSRFNIRPVYEGYEDPTTKRWKQELVGYSVTNTITVKTMNLDSATGIIDGAVSAGANKVNSVYFTLSPEKQLQIKDDLLANAIINAKTKAELALSPLDHQIIGVQSISLSEFSVPYSQPTFRGDFAIESNVSTPVFSSKQDITTSAHVVFIIGSN